eukprot:TRINITY_DN2178_c0_g1_i1.p1 TRINITY_DN2178_c0_g1~~TRINITY_DN2178_c0_g1_i1.p1  ORF type:complete len:207 (-),score=74.81 TRINITY_DN2178_c0_g1_i1:48-608(-)
MSIMTSSFVSDGDVIFDVLTNTGGALRIIGQAELNLHTMYSSGQDLRSTGLDVVNIDENAVIGTLYVSIYAIEALSAVIASANAHLAFQKKEDSLNNNSQRMNTSNPIRKPNTLNRQSKRKEDHRLQSQSQSQSTQSNQRKKEKQVPQLSQSLRKKVQVPFNLSMRQNKEEAEGDDYGHTGALGGF